MCSSVYATLEFRRRYKSSKQQPAIQTCVDAQANADAADVLGLGEALAYGVASSVGVVDVRRMKLATVLAGGHRGSPVTAVAWCALSSPRETTERS